ncbi:MAG: MFS transporter [Steroidobacteraceae bacterium]
MTQARDEYPVTTAWYVVGLLTAVYIVSFIDRQILSLLIEPIRQEMGLSDFQMSWIGPPAFAICFLFFGLVFGNLADRFGRLRLIALGLALWCGMTAACAFAETALEMFVARMGVGVGEAVLTPCALSLISDMFARDKVGKPIGVYSSGVALGSSLAFILGGALILWLERGDHDPFYFFGISTTWRETFLLVGLPGLLLLPLLLWAKEPARRERLTDIHTISFFQTAQFLSKNRRVYIPLFFGKSAFNLIAYAHFWIVPMFARTWGWSPARTGAIWGTTLLLSGLTGVLIGGWLSDYWYRNGRKEAAIRTMWLALLITIPLHAVAPLMPSGELAIALFIPALVAAGAGSSAGSTATMLVTPNEYRGQMIALSLLIASGLGQFLGPTTVAGLTDFIFADPKALRYSLSLAVFSFSIVAFLILSSVLKRYTTTVTELEERLGKKP